PEPAPPRRRVARGLQLQTGSPRWPPQTGSLTPNSTSLTRPCGCSLPSMTAPSGSSCIGIKLPLQAHLVLEESEIGQVPPCGSTILPRFFGAVHGDPCSPIHIFSRLDRRQA